MAEKIKVVGYVRVSTPMQVNGKVFSSIEAQTLIIKQFVSSNPEMELVGIFEEPGRTGRNMRRPGMQALLNRVKKGDIKLVLSYKLDRISRDTFDYYAFERLVAEHNTRVYYTNSYNSDGTPQGEFVKGLMVNLAALESGQTSERIKDKIKESLKVGYKCGGYAPIGYVCGEKAKTMEIDHSTAPMVREIFKLFHEGLSMAGIVRHMADKYGEMPSRITRKGVRHDRGKFSENKLARILQNPIYAGYVFTRRPALELYEGLHEAIIDRRLWEEVQEKLKQRPVFKKIAVRQCNPYLLKKFLFCSCGANMTVGGSGKVHKDGSPYRYYVCSHKTHFRAQSNCNTRISLNVIEAVLFSVIGSFATQEIKPEDITKSHKDCKKALLAEKRSTTIRKSNAERDAKIAAERFRTLELNEILSSIIKEDLQGLTLEIGRLEYRLGQIDEELKRYENEISPGDIHNRAILDNLDALQKDLTLEERKEILTLCISKIVIKAKNKGNYKRDFSLVIYPSKSYVSVFQTAALEVLFSLDNSKGKGEWIITAPFELKCDNFGKVTASPNRGKIKRHWLHEVARWKKEVGAGTTHEEIAAKSNVGRPMITRKLKLWDDLNPDVIEHILSLKYERDTEPFSFRYLDKLAKLQKSRQWVKFSSTPNTTKSY